MKMRGQFKWKTGGQLQYYFAKFAVSFITKYTGTYRLATLANVLLNERENIDTNLWFDSFSPDHISYLVLKFKNIIETNYELE